MHFGRHNITPSVASFTASFPYSTKFTYCKRRLNAVETWQQAIYKLLHVVTHYSFLHSWAGLNKAQMKWQWKLIWYLLQLTSHPGWFLAGGWLNRLSTSSVQPPMVACLGQYRTCTYMYVAITWQQLLNVPSWIETSCTYLVVAVYLTIAVLYRM